MSRIRRHEVYDYFKHLKKLIISKKIEHKFLVKDIKTIPPFDTIRPSKLGIILSMMSDSRIIDKLDKPTSGPNYVQEYQIR